MSSKERDEKILEFFRNVLKVHDVNKDGSIASKELGSVLATLSRPSNAESVATLVKRFDPDDSGNIVWNDEELLLVVALMDVEDAKKIEDSIFSIGFKIFAKVRQILLLKIQSDFDHCHHLISYLKTLFFRKERVS